MRWFSPQALGLALAFLALASAWPADSDDDPLRPSHRRDASHDPAHDPAHDPLQDYPQNINDDNDNPQNMAADHHRNRASSSPRVMYEDPGVLEERYQRDRLEYLDQEVKNI